MKSFLHIRISSLLYLVELLFVNCSLLIAHCSASCSINRANYTICSNSYPSSYQAQSWSISETDIGNSAGFNSDQTNATLDISLSEGFEFKTSSYIATVTASGSEIRIKSFTFISQNLLRVTITTSSENNEYNTIFFINFEVLATANGLNGEVYRSGGNFKIDNSAVIPISSEYLATLSTGTSWNYSGSSVQQSSINDIRQATSNNDILEIAITGTGNCGAAITAFYINTIADNGTGTKRLKNIEKIKVWYTGNSGSFATTNLFGGTTDTLRSNLVQITGNQTLTEGTNYFWVSYDVPDDAYTGNLNDSNKVSCKLMCFVLNGITKKDMLVSQPSGDIVIPNKHYYTVSSGSFYDNIWSWTNNGPLCNCAPEGSGVLHITPGKTLALKNNNFTVDAIDMQPGSAITGNGNNSKLTINNDLTLRENSSFEIGGDLIINGNLNILSSAKTRLLKNVYFNGDIRIGSNAILALQGNPGGNLRIKGNAVIDGRLEQTLHNTIFFDGYGTQTISGNGYIKSYRILLENGNKVIPHNANITLEGDIHILGDYSVTCFGKINTIKVKNNSNPGNSNKITYNNYPKLKVKPNPNDGKNINIEIKK